MSNFTEWVLDAPLFIDEVQVRALYDAIVKPENEVQGITIADKTLTSNLSKVSSSIGADISAEGGVNFLAKLKASITGKIDAGTEDKTDESDETVWTLKPVDNSYRQLLHLVAHYLANSAERISVCSNIGNFPNDEYITATPRALVFMDLIPTPEKGVVLIPTAFETTEGKVIVVADKLDQAILKDYPNSRDHAELLAYWQAYTDAFSAQKTMVKLENLITEAKGKVQWIDYRMPIWAKPDASDIVATGHLHLAARGCYDTGTFGYNFVKRGYRHGLRIVGTLKSEPDINVLAVFER
ncbi:hypothetical protein BN971_01837 [Mycobacterium bohemicum DSM 44277]|uniref:Uncharacterized protein n=1 Tax=Mycobacterium bohemicum DSM 44277 TaxID=1236609 RepID=A0A0U0W8B3_MYCBE|nr:hypothetical protein [Mycobacterium bohemicum]MCV6970049.1 hypothetical protein [Mycobacterium bohemicum]CPR10401.1 hypothetical protein BN971_01837 [Mycobacterium bohemicum DSM 44277]